MSDRFLEIVSGARRDWVGRVARGGLTALSWPYGLGVALRNAAYDRGWRAVHRAPGPVVCVGNLTAGGTGKTPLVEAIASRWLGQGRRVAIVGRGYGAARGELNDELRLLRDNLPAATVLANPDRWRGAREAFSAGAEVVLLDDGFQHRRLARDLDLVTIDAACPFGFDRLLPRGLLREGRRGLARAGAVVITRSDRATNEDLARLEREVRRWTPKAVIARSRHRPMAIVDPGGERRPLASIYGRSVLVFSGLARNDLFVESVRALRADVRATRSFADHHDYRPNDLEALAAQAQAQGADCLLTTQKDAVKLATIGELPVHWLAIELEISSGDEALWDRLDAVLTEQNVPRDAFNPTPVNDR